MVIKQFRERIGFSQAQAAKLFGVSQAMVSRWECGEQIDADRAKDIERRTGGALTLAMLRPDLFVPAPDGVFGSE